MVKELKTKAEFKAALADAGDKLVVVDFFAQWCGPCKMIAPKIENLASSTPDVHFYKVDVDQNEEVASDEKISAMPTFRFYKGGKMIKEVVGADFPSVSAGVNQHK